MGIKKTAFDSIDTKLKELRESLAAKENAAHRVQPRGGATVKLLMRSNEEDLQALSVRCIEQCKWMREHSALPPLCGRKEWRTKSEESMRELYETMLARLTGFLSKLSISSPEVLRTAQEILTFNYQRELTRLRLKLEAQNDETVHSFAKVALSAAKWVLVGAAGYFLRVALEHITK